MPERGYASGPDPVVPPRPPTSNGPGGRIERSTAMATAGGGGGLWMACELCGAPLHRVRLNERGNGTGPWLEYREHLASNGTHRWEQEHNCQDPQPDDCTFCVQGGSDV